MSSVAPIGNYLTYAITGGPVGPPSGGQVGAATLTMVPNSDVTTGWPATSGTNDGSCSAGVHCNFVDDGTTDKTSDYITTSGSTSGNEVEEYGLTNPTSVGSASKIILRFYAMSTTNASGGTLDTLSINLRVGGTLQTAGSCTPSYSTWTACTATFTGSWSQSDVDSMQAYVQRVVQGSGNPSKKADTLQLANVYGTLTYMPSLTISQSAYRWLGNQDVSGPTTFVVDYNNFSATDTANDVVTTSDGGYAITGSTNTASSGGGYDMFLAKYDASGNLSWNKTWGSTGADVGMSLVQTSDGGYAVTGYTPGSSGNDYDMFLAKYDASGNLSWNKTWSGGGDDRGHSIVQTTDGGYIITGRTSNDLQTTFDMFLAKYDASGNLSWSKTWSGDWNDSGYSIVQTTDGGYAVSGFTYSGPPDMFLAKYDASGNLSWSKTWGGTGTDVGTSLVQTSDNGYAITGYTGSYGAGGDDMFLAKYDASGNLSWSKTWGSSGNDSGDSIVQTTDGGYAVAGATGADAFLAKYDSSGTITDCSATMCQSPSVTTTSPAVTTIVPTVTTAIPTVTTAAPTARAGFGGGSSSSIVRPLIAVGLPLAAQDTAAAAPSDGVIYRLRLDVHVSDGQASQSVLNLKLQYAAVAASVACNSSSPAPTYSDVTDSTVVRYADNPNALSGMGLTASTNDPVHGTDTTVLQDYLESGTSTFTNPNAIPEGQDGMWDFALTTQGASAGTKYCFRIANSSSGSLIAADVYPSFTVSTATQGVSIVDSSGTAIASPNYVFSPLYIASTCQTASGVFGTGNQQLRVSEGSAGSGFSVSIAPSGGATALWSDSSSSYYDFNDSSGSPAGCNSGSDGDGYAGQLTIDPSAASIAPQTGCASTGLSLGSAAGYSSGVTDSITLLSGSSSVATGCYWDLTGINMSQTVPSQQPAGQYALNMTVTMVAQ